MPEIVFLVLICGYFILSVLFVIGVKKKFPTIKEELPTASVIVAVRNEEKNILSCLKSLGALNYPENKLEIIIVDDVSEDDTTEIVKQFITGKRKFKLLSLVEDGSKILKGKVRAVAEGVKSASGEIILTTDADCEVNPGWVKAIASYYQDDVAIVNGFTTQKVSGWSSGIQAIDFIYLLFVASGTINLGKPISCIGNNMSFRKKAYHEVGGYENLPFSVTEDFMLLNSISNLKKYKIIYPLDENALVTSLPCPNFKELFRQKKRWAVGGFDAPPFGLLIMSWAFLTNLCLILTLLFFSTVWLYLIVFKIAIDFFVLLPVHQKLSLTKNLKYFPVYELYHILYVVLLPFFLLFNKKVIWKGRKY